MQRVAGCGRPNDRSIRNALVLAILLWLVYPAAAPAATPPLWDTLVSIAFVIHAPADGFPVACTGWFLAPVRAARPPVSAYATAGHCDDPHIVRNDRSLEHTAVLARIVSTQHDVAIGLRLDGRPYRSFLPLATAPPPVGEPALVAGWPRSQLGASRLAYLGAWHGFLRFRSSLALRPGISGAPIASLRTLASSVLVVSLALLGNAALAHDAPAPGDSGGGSGGPGEKTQISPSARTFFNQGEAYSKKKSWDLAVQAYAQAVRTDPKFAEAWNNMGYCYRKLKQYDKALDAYKHALDLKPAFTYAHEYMARTYIAMGNKDEAMREYEILNRLDAKMADEVIKAIQANDADLGDTD